MTEDRPSLFMRAQVPTEFAAVLRRLVRSIPGGVGAAFCDAEGECIDYYGPIDPFDMKIAGAQLAPVHEDLARRLGAFLGSDVTVHMRGEKTSYLYLRISADYYVVAILSAYASWWEALDDIAAARKDMRREAGVG